MGDDNNQVRIYERTIFEVGGISVFGIFSVTQQKSVAVVVEDTDALLSAVVTFGVLFTTNLVLHVFSYIQQNFPIV